MSHDIESQLDKLREEYLQAKYPGDLADDLAINLPEQVPPKPSNSEGQFFAPVGLLAASVLLAIGASVFLMSAELTGSRSGIALMTMGQPAVVASPNLASTNNVRRRSMIGLRSLVSRKSSFFSNPNKLTKASKHAIQLRMSPIGRSNRMPNAKKPKTKIWKDMQLAQRTPRKVTPTGAEKKSQSPRNRRPRFQRRFQFDPLKLRRKS